MAEAGGDAGDSKPVTDPVVVEIHKKIREAFSPFDHDNNGTVDVRYVRESCVCGSNILRSCN